nr:reverse transcriptase domain-containing protein [Tanacetum cinerariifolium]
MNSIEQCIIKKARHEQDNQNRLKRLNKRKLQILECKVQKVKATDASSGDINCSGIVSDKRNDQGLGIKETHLEMKAPRKGINEDPPEVPMADNRTMAQLLQAPTVGYEDAIVIPEIAAMNFELKHGLINLVQNKQFFGHDKEDPHAHIRYFNKITYAMRFPNVPNSTIKLMLLPFSLEGAARIWLEKEPLRSILTWDDLVSKFINQACPHHGFSELYQLNTFYNALNVNDQDSLNSAAGISSDVAKLKDMVRALLLDKKNQSSAPAPSPTPAYQDNIQ